MEEKLNLYSKLQKVRVELQQSDLKKSGENTYSKYKYFEAKKGLVAFPVGILLPCPF